LDYTNECELPVMPMNEKTLQIQNYTLSIYPNPVNTDQLNVQMAKEEQQSSLLILYNVLGQPVLETYLWNMQNFVSLQGMNAGNYLYTIFSTEGEILLQGKLVKLNN
jgi:hypothetical protein